MRFDTFAMGLGRSGSMALTNIVKQHPEINFPNEEKNGLLLHLGRIDLGAPKKVNMFLSHSPQWHFKNFDHLRYFLTFQRMIHLLRNPVDIMKSLCNSYIYSSLGAMPKDWHKQFFESDSNCMASSHPALLGPMVDCFRDNFCILFEELSPDCISKTTMNLFNWLDVDEYFQPSDLSVLSYSNRFIFLNKIKASLSINGCDYPVYLTRQALPPGIGLRRNTSKFILLGRFCIADSAMSQWLSVNDIFCWFDITASNNEVLDALVNSPDCFRTHLYKSIENWYEKVTWLDRKIQKKLIWEVPSSCRKKLYLLNKKGIGALDKIRPGISDAWVF